MAVEPNELIDRKEFAEVSSSSDAISGRTLSQAGSKNVRTVAARNRRTYITSIPVSLPNVVKPIGIRSTRMPRSRSEASRIRFRLNRSTKTPAKRPTKSVGRAVTISTRPTFNAEPVSRNTRMPAARSVSAEPIVETSWASQSSEKSRFRKMANICGRVYRAAKPGIRSRSGAGMPMSTPSRASSSRFSSSPACRPPHQPPP